MGLIGNLKDAVRKTVDEKVDATRDKMQESTIGRMTLGAMDARKNKGVMVTPWPVSPATQTYRLPPEHEAIIYTYDGAALSGVKVNERFVVTAVPAEVTMTSVYTGMTASTSDYDNVAYEYNGYIFGMASSHAEAVKRMMRNGYRVEVEAYIKGYDRDAGYPKVCGLFGFVDDSVYLGLGR